VRPATPEGVIVDATLGLGGHAEALLDANPGARLLGIDRDPDALAIARERLARFGERCTIVQGTHDELIEISEREKVETIGAVLADLGVSSLQLDDPERGFSFRFDAPLDMRMSRSGPTASDLVNTMEERELASVIYEYGEEPMSRRIARAIVEARAEEPIETTGRLAGIVRSVKKPRRGVHIDPATLTFQAIRIATNGEIVRLEQFLLDAFDLLGTGGRLGVISFHSLEDRIVKRTFRSLEGECVCPPRMPLCGCGARKRARLLTRRPVEAGAEERERNPRSRSAKLRVAEKVEEQPMDRAAGGSGGRGRE
jgi:16S rRNA (cytosine1402-N4)-methyltransferase